MQPALSLVVPVYNVAPYLAACLDSILAEKLPRMEVIAVDDGSTDECPAILARYAERHPLLRVIRQANGGLSAARNAGLAHARGEYLAFADSDDTILPGYYAGLLALARRHDLDLAHGNGIYDFEGRQAESPIYRDSLPGVMEGREVLRRRLKERTLLHMVWLQLYRRRFIEDLQLRFVPPLIHEDVLWTTRAFLAARRVAYQPTPGYRYRQRLRRLDPLAKDARLKLIIDSSIYNARGLAEVAAGIRDDAELQRLLAWQLTDGGLAIFHKVAQLSSPDLRRQSYRRLRADGVFPLLWRHALEWRQRRRIARHWAKSCFA